MFAMVDMWIARGYNKVRDFFRKEDGGSEMIAVVLLIGIAVILGLLFKDKITELVNNMMNQISTDAMDAIKPT